MSFGADSAIELASASALLWRLRNDSRLQRRRSRTRSDPPASLAAAFCKLHIYKKTGKHPSALFRIWKRRSTGRSNRN